MTDAGPPALALDGVSRRFGGVVAVDGVSLTLGAGERVSVIGPNGAGKTTLFRLIAGEMRPSGGRINLLGRDVTRMAAHHRAGLGLARTFQVSNLFVGLTVLENVRLASQTRGRDRWRFWSRMSADDAPGRAAREALEHAGLQGRAPRPGRRPVARRATPARGRDGARQRAAPAAARRAGGRSRDRRAGTAPEAARGSAAHPPGAPDRARHVAGARTRRPRHVHAQREGHRIRDARRGAARRDRPGGLPRPGGGAVLEVVDLEAGYASARVLNGISLRVGEGEVLALLGRNGMGKTTLLRSICGLRPPVATAGSIRFRGSDVRTLAAHQVARCGISIVPQGRRVFASPDRRGEPPDRPAAARPQRVGHRLGVRAVPPPPRTFAAARRDPVGRGAADARDRSVAHGQPRPDHHGRAVGGAVAGGASARWASGSATSGRAARRCCSPSRTWTSRCRSRIASRSSVTVASCRGPASPRRSARTRRSSPSSSAS